MKQDLQDTIRNVLDNLPSEWIDLTTHRLDLYNEQKAKVEFLESFEALGIKSLGELKKLPTAFDYIRLGRPLSCILEWIIAKEDQLDPERVISFSSQMMPLMAVLRKNKFSNKKTTIFYEGSLPNFFDADIISSVYEYQFDLVKVDDLNDTEKNDGIVVILKSSSLMVKDSKADFIIDLYPSAGSIIKILNEDSDFCKEIQHVRRRESIAMTPQSCLEVLQTFVGREINAKREFDKTNLLATIQNITKVDRLPLLLIVVSLCNTHQ